MADPISYDVVIIGGGPGGYNAAIRAGQLGLKAAVVEKRVTLGGTCLNVGCMPSKALLHASELFEAAGKEFAHLGIEVTPSLNLPQMMKQKGESVTQLTKGIEFLFKKNKVDWIKGEGRITGQGQVEVTAEDGGKTALAAKNIVIATGSEPAGLPGVALDSSGSSTPPARFLCRRFQRAWWSSAPASSGWSWALCGVAWGRRSPSSSSSTASPPAWTSRSPRRSSGS